MWRMNEHKHHMEIQLHFSPQIKSAETVASIADLLTEILLRLPVKSILRFKLVSKRWLNLICHPRFCQLLNPNPNPAVGLFLPSGELGHAYVPFHPLSSQLVSLPSGVRILQSCNGLMLCCRVDDPAGYFAYNPTTNKLSNIVLPKLDDGILIRTIRGINLAFDPVKSFHYKIVSVRSLETSTDTESRFEILVYSSETHSWRVQSEPFTCPADFDRGVYWNGAVHWMGSVRNQESFYFNVETQTLSDIPIPPLTFSRHCKRDQYYFGESCDRLHFIDMRGPQLKLVVHELKRDYSQWFVKYQVDLSAVVVANPAMASRRGNPMFWCGFVFQVLAVVRGEEDEDSLLVLQIPGKLVRYNIVRKTFQDLVEFEGGNVRSSLRYPNVIAFQYIQSLSCV